MNHNYRSVIACLLFPILGIDILSAQSEFLQCTPVPESLCVQDEGIRLPANNQLYLGEGHPDATSCSVHVTQKKNVLSTCGGSLQYEVQLYLNDTSTAYVLKPLTIITADSNGMAELYFDTEESPDVQISASGIPYTTGCLRYHRIKWIVTDTCGTESVCEQLIDLYDCKVPLVSNDTDDIYTILIPFNNQLILFAKDFINEVLDDCTATDNFLYSLKENEYIPDSNLVCNQVPAFGVPIKYNVWIADEGKDLDCNGSIEWSERDVQKQEITIVFINSKNCEFPIGSPLSGNVRDRHDDGIQNVFVSLEQTGHFYPTFQTGDDGKYYFSEVLGDNPLTIRSEKNDNHKNGVSTLDLVKIQKHILGIELFTNPYQTIAADANNSQFLSAIDLVQIRKLILGIDTEFPNNQSWRFIRKDFIFGDTMNPWPIVDASTITITDIENPGNTNFIGIKIGDVNGTALPHFSSIIPREILKPFNLLTDQIAFNAGEIINVPIRISSSQSLTGFQFTLKAIGLEIVDVLPGSIPLTDGEYALFGDKMTIAWFDEDNVDVTADEVLFTLVLKAKQGGNLSQSIQINSDITDAEIYLGGEQTFIPVLNVINPGAEAALQIMSCAPNPWKDETTLFFYLPEPSDVIYNVIDVNGRKIYSDHQYLTEGYHNYTLKAADFSARGILFLEVNAGGSRMVEKMVLME